jgi:hypothetical protein
MPRRGPRVGAGAGVGAREELSGGAALKGCEVSGGVGTAKLALQMQTPSAQRPWPPEQSAAVSHTSTCAHLRAPPRARRRRGGAARRANSPQVDARGQNGRRGRGYSRGHGRESSGGEGGGGRGATGCWRRACRRRILPGPPRNLPAPSARLSAAPGWALLAMRAPPGCALPGARVAAGASRVLVPAPETSLLPLRGACR